MDVHSVLSGNPQGPASHADIATFIQQLRAVHQAALTWQEDTIKTADLTHVLDHLAAATQLLEQQSDYHQTVFNALSHDNLCVWDKDLRFIEGNDAFSRLVGKDQTELQGQSLSLLIPNLALKPEDIVSRVQSLLKTGFLQMVRTFPAADGQVRHIELNLTYLAQFPIYIALGRDISERVRMQQTLQDSLDKNTTLLQQFEAVFGSIADGIVIYAADGNELLRNAAAQRFLGTSPLGGSRNNDAPTQFQLRTLKGQPLRALEFPVERVFRSGQATDRAYYRLTAADGQKHIIQMHALPIRDDNDAVIFVVNLLHDVTKEYLAAQQNEILRRLGHVCAQAIDIEKVAESAIALLVELLDIEHCTIVIKDDSRPGYAKVLAQQNNHAFTSAQLQELTVRAEHTLIAPVAPFLTLQVLATGEAWFNESPLPIEAHADGSPANRVTRSDAYLPLQVNTETFGVLNLGFSMSQEQQREMPEQQLLLAIAAEIGLALHRARLYQTARTYAYVDPLTGLHNHRAMQQHLLETMSVARTLGIPLSVIMLDVDHFRTFNETYGHDIGDRALKMVADAIQQAIRESDFSARYGGEEFVIILPRTGAHDARIVAERVLEKIATAQLYLPNVAHGLSITASLGVTSFPLHSSVPASLLKAADIALYAAKHGGRNQVVLYSTELLDAEKTIPVLPEDATLEMIEALITGIDLHDGYTAAHSQGVSRYALAIGVQMNLASSDLEILRIGGLIHDVGKLVVPTKILTKKDKLTPAEWQAMQAHVQYGYQMIEGVTELKAMLPLIRSHHERMDGSGYPDGLQGEQIPFLVRILSVADVYETFTATRPYYAGRTQAEGLAYLQQEAENYQFDPLIVAAFTRALTTQSPHLHEYIRKAA